MRRALTLLALAAAPVLAGCVGDTDPATNVGAAKATLRAHGHTNNGPASFWWEYGPRRTAVAGGGGTKTPVRGPAASASDVSLSENVTGLGADQHYFFRACGKDAAAGSTATCGSVREFVTAPSVSTIGGSHLETDFTAGTASRHRVSSYSFNGNFYFSDYVDLPQTSDPPIGSELSAPGCTVVPAQGGILDFAHCPSGSANRVKFVLGPYDDSLDASGLSVSVAASAQDGNDTMTGGPEGDILSGGNNDDVIHGGDGPDTIRGDDGNDQLYGGPGVDTFDCGPGTDQIHVDDVNEWLNSTGCEGYIIDGL